MPQPAWSVVVPVKRLALAKTRLAELAGPRRPELALAMAADTVTAALECPSVAVVVTVTDDPQAADTLRRLGAGCVADVPDQGLNAALTYAARIAQADRPDSAIAALSADLPAMRADELERALLAAAAHPRALVADASGDGTTLLTAQAGTALAPAYGEGSAARHRATGAVALRLHAPGLRRDVDRPADLWAAAALGVGPHTAAVLAGLDR